MKQRLKMLLLPVVLVVAVFALSACQYNHEAFASKDGYVACALSGVNAKGVAWNGIQGFGGVSVRQGSCDGPAVPAVIGVEVHLFQNVSPFQWELCRQSGLVIDSSTGFTVTITNVVGAGSTGRCSAPSPGQLHMTLVVGHAFITGTPYVSNFVESGVEGWSAP